MDDGGVGTVIPPPLELEGVVKPAVVVLLIDDVALFLDRFFLLALSPRASSINASVIWRRSFRMLCFLANVTLNLRFFSKSSLIMEKIGSLRSLAYQSLARSM